MRRGSAAAQAGGGRTRFLRLQYQFDLGAEIREARFADGISREFAQFLDERLASDAKPSTPAAPAIAIPPASPAWNEALYLAVNPDVAAAIARKEFVSGREHYDRIGRTQRRDGGSVPTDWDEIGYRQVNPDVAHAIAGGWFLSGYHQYLLVGRSQGRLGGFQPADWNEGRYLAANPDARNRLAQGTYRTGYLHYVAIGLSQGLAGGLPPRGLVRLAALALADPQSERCSSCMKASAWSSPVRRPATQWAPCFAQSQAATFDDLGVRVWPARRGAAPAGRICCVCSAADAGRRAWGPTLAPPTLVYCFTNPRTGMSTFDPFRFMLRRAYAEGTDLRIFVTPVHAVIRELFSRARARRAIRVLAAGTRAHQRGGGRARRTAAAAAVGFQRRQHDHAANRFLPPATMPRCDGSGSIRTIARSPAISCSIACSAHSEPERPLPRGFRRPADRGQHRRAYRARQNPSSRAWAAANSDLVSPIVRAAQTSTTHSRQAEATCW